MLYDPDRHEALQPEDENGWDEARARACIDSIARDTEAKPVRVWAFTRGFPVKWTGPELNALSPGVAFETLELVHRGVRVKQSA